MFLVQRIFALCLNLGGITSDALPFRDELPLEYASSTRGRARLEIDEPKVVIGQTLNVTLTYTNDGGGAWFFNPFFNPLLPAPAALALYDAQKNYVGDLLAPSEGSRRAVGDGDWVYIPGGRASVAVEMSRTAGGVPGTKYYLPANPLPAGTYYLQAIYYNAFIGVSHPGSKVFGPKDGKELIENFDTGELFRSNVVQIELLQASAAPATAPTR